MGSQRHDMEKKTVYTSSDRNIYIHDWEWLEKYELEVFFPLSGDCDISHGILGKLVASTETSRSNEIEEWSKKIDFFQVENFMKKVVQAFTSLEIKQEPSLFVQMYQSY